MKNLQETLLEGEVNGIKFRVSLHPKRGKKIQITVKCPKCGEEGILNKTVLKGRKLKFKVIHSRNPVRSCCFSWTTPGYEELKDIYDRCHELKKVKDEK